MSLTLIQRKLDRLKDKEESIKQTFDIRGINKNQHRYIDDLREDYKRDMVLKMPTHTQSQDLQQISDSEDSGVERVSDIPKDEELDVYGSENYDSPSLQSPSNNKLTNSHMSRPLSSQTRNRPGTASLRPGTAQLRPGTASLKRPGTAQRVTFDDPKVTSPSNAEASAISLSGRPLSGLSRPFSASQSKPLLSGLIKTGPPGFFPSGVRPMSAINTGFTHFNEQSDMMPNSPDMLHPELGQDQAEVIRSNYQNMLTRPKSADTQFWKNTKKYDNVHAKPKTQNYSIRPLLFEFKHNHPNFISSVDLEYLHNDHLTNRFNTSKLIKPQNHTFMDIVTKMAEDETLRDETIPNDTTEIRGARNTLKKVKTEENLKFAEKSFKDSLGFFANIRKENESQPNLKIRPNPSSDLLRNSSLKPQSTDRKGAGRLRAEKGKLDIQDIVLFKYLTNEEKIKMFKGLSFITSKRSKSKHLSAYSELERELIDNHDWSNYRQQLRGCRVSAVLINLENFDNICIRSMEIHHTKLVTKLANELVDLETLQSEFEELTRSKATLLLIYSTHHQEKDSKNLLLKRFVISSQESSLDRDMGLIYRFYLTLLLLNNPDKRVTENVQYDNIHYFIEDVIEERNNKNVTLIWREILRLKEENIWLDYKVGMKEIHLQDYLKGKYPALADLFLLKDAKDYKRIESILSPISIKHPENLHLSEVRSNDSISVINKSIQDIKSRMNTLVSPKSERPFSAQAVIGGLRPQSAVNRTKPQSYQKQIADMKERTQTALGQSATSFRSSMQQRQEGPNEPQFLKTFQSDDSNRFLGNEVASSYDLGSNPFIQDDNQVTMRYRQPVLKPKHNKNLKPYRTITVTKRSIQPHESNKRAPSFKQLLTNELISIRGNNTFNNSNDFS